VAEGLGKNTLLAVATGLEEKELDDVDLDGSTRSDGDVS
jgi:ABC-type nitrate/sulfonate/bicarbonate transport system ATPase subunit